MADEFVAQARKILADQPKANGLTLRGFSAKPQLPSYEEVYGLRAAAIAVYPMYKGLARLVGMEIVGKAANARRADRRARAELERLRLLLHPLQIHRQHRRGRQLRGQSANGSKSSTRSIPRITALKPTVLIVTGDHSTPALKSHSWHPVPTLLVSDVCRTDACQAFGETECLRGGLGQFEAKYLMPLALANAGRLGKYGA